MPTTAYLHIGDCFHGWELIGFEVLDLANCAIFRKGSETKPLALEPTRSWLSVMFELKASTTAA